MNGIDDVVDQKTEDRVRKGLDRSYALAIERKYELPIGIDQARIIIFSDLHRGVRDGADDFLCCEPAYCAALGYYLEAGYTLIVLGDAEEFWECRPAPVVNAYRATLRLEAEFHKQNRYYRIYGNHDDFWEQESGIKKLLDPIFGAPLPIRENLRILIKGGPTDACEIFLVHGHQGDYLSDQARTVSKFFVRYFWRPFQRITKLKLSTPAKDFTLRDELSIAIYHWTEQRRGMVLVAGHTHLPVFESRDHASRIEEQLAVARTAGDSAKAADLRAQLESTRANATGQGSRGFSMQRPSYFNTGCCSFSDGDVTGIEIADGSIKLVRWPDDAGNPRAKVLQEARLLDVFTAVGA
jgi:UDP-2,3-diacylglucosamine pyrophosphatase LpxH